MKHYLINLTKGMLIGIANIIPGVSGGTIAVILGLFDKIINAISEIPKSKNRLKKCLYIL